MLNKPTTHPSHTSSVPLSPYNCPADLLKIYKNAAQSPPAVRQHIAVKVSLRVFFKCSALPFRVVCCLPPRCGNAAQRGACGTNGSCCLAHINNNNSGMWKWQMVDYIVSVCVGVCVCEWV